MDAYIIYNTHNTDAFPHLAHKVTIKNQNTQILRQKDCETLKIS